MARAKKSEPTEIGSHAVSDQEILAGYNFEAPLLITEHKLIEPTDTKCWESGSAWVKYLAGIGAQENENGALKGVVIPLELKADEEMARQESHGVELLTWLRWSAKEPHRFVPVLTTAFQPLESVLRRKKSLLLVANGTQYYRLPDSLTRDRLVAFITDVRGTKFSELCADVTDLNSLAGTGCGAQPGATYHDFANRNYAALRLWEGYKAALGKPTTKINMDELARVKEVEGGFAWKNEIDELLTKPDVKQYLALAKQGLGTPKYPTVKHGDDAIKKHVQEGLPKRTRILLVDDEFDKGLADVLLGILFKDTDAKFNFKNESTEEWVYSDTTDPEKPWARLVCVKTADLAIHWLAYWGDIDRNEDGYNEKWAFKLKEQDWLSAWKNGNSNSNDKPLNAQSVFEKRKIDSFTVAAAQYAAYKNHNSVNRNKNTIVLLDLRLEREDQREAYDPQDLTSVKLRNLIKLKRKREPAPVIMLTASRQAMNYSLIMKDATGADGWLMKEGPDIFPDDENSANAVHYLLQRLRTLAARPDWFRKGMAKTDDELKQFEKLIDNYECFLNNPNWKSLLKVIQDKASECYKAALNQENDFKKTAPTEWMNNYFSEFENSELFLARRLFAFGMLFQTGKVKNKKFTPQKHIFNQAMPGYKERGENKAEIAVVYNFSSVFGHSYGHLKEKKLLKEEYNWLLEQFKSDQDKKEYLEKIIKEISESESQP